MDKCPKNKEYECSEEKVAKCRSLSDEDLAKVCGGGTKYVYPGDGGYGMSIEYTDIPIEQP